MTPSPSPSPAPGVVALDRFERDVVCAWGKEQIGATWTFDGAPAAFSVDGRAGIQHLWTDGWQGATLYEVWLHETAIEASIRARAVSPGNDAFAALAARVVDGGEYRAVIRFDAEGRAFVRLVRVRGTAVEVLADEVRVPGYLADEDGALRLRFVIDRENDTRLRLFAWPAGGAAAATAPILVARDGTPVLQRRGSVSLLTRLESLDAGSATTVRFDRVVVSDPTVVVEPAGPTVTGDPGPAATPHPEPRPAPTAGPTPAPSPEPSPEPAPAPSDVP